MKVLAQVGQNAKVEDVIDTGFQKIESSDMLQSAMERLQTCNCKIMPVVSNNSLSGLLNIENVGEFMMIHAALQRRKN